MLEKLSSALKKTTDKIANAIFLDKNLVEGIVKELQRALIEADVNVALVRELSEKIKKAAFDERIKGIEKKEHLIKILHDELIKILGEKRDIKLGKKNVFMFVGLYGVGKTTTIGKVASYYAKRGHSVCAVGLDVHRAAAPEQLRQVCEKINVPCFVESEEKDALKIWRKFKKEIFEHEIVLVDTAGRDALDDSLINEIKQVAKEVKASESFLVMAADIGQAAKKQAQAFREAAGVTGVIITRMDSTARGGGALSACAEVNAPVVFIGTGEKTNDLEIFEPEGFLSRMLGMGDLKGLMEKIHSVIDKKEIEKTQARLAEGKFTLRDLQTQLDSVGEIGSFDKLIGMVPGLGKLSGKIPEGQLEQQQAKVKNWKNAINSMTSEEIENPEILEKETSRIQRVARGSGCSTSDVRALIKQYKMLRELIKSQGELAGGNLDQKTMMKLAKKFGRKMKF